MSDITPVSRRSYANLDCIRLDDGRVMVVPNTPCHRTMEEYVPVAEVERLRGVANEHSAKRVFWRFAAFAGWMLWLVAMVATVTT